MNVGTLTLGPAWPTTSTLPAAPPRSNRPEQPPPATDPALQLIAAVTQVGQLLDIRV